MEACSGCGEKKITVNRNMFDGMCVACTNRALFDEKLAEKARKKNKELKKNGKP